MSVILRCTNDNGLVRDISVQENTDLRLDISAIENATIGDVYGISSQEFSIAGSNEVDQFFGNVWNLGATPAVALEDSIPCQVLYNGAEVFKGKLYIKNVITNQQGFTLYNVIVVNETVDFKFELQDTYLSQLDFSRFNHDFTYANVSQSWYGNLLSGSIVYPFVNYGRPEGDADAPDYAFAAFNSSGSNTIDNYNSPLRLIDFKPAIKTKDIVDIIFSGSSYDYTSSFFNSNYFENLYVLATADDQLGPNNISPVSQSAWAYISSSVQSISANTQVGVNWDAEVVDNANNFDLAADRYTADTTGLYQYQINVSYFVNSWTGPTPTDKVTIILRKNGSTIVDNQQYPAPPASGSAFLEGGVNLVPGDYLEVEMGAIGKAITLRNDQGQPSYFPVGNISYFQLKGPASLLEGNVDMAAQFPDDLKALDFLQGLIEKFNLVVEPVPNSRNLIRIEPYQDWINAGRQVDWSDKVDRNERFSIVHPITEQPRTILFSDEQDEDVINKFTLDTKGIVYGSYTFTSDSDLAEGEKRIGKVFAPTPVTGIPNGRQFIVPHLCSVTDNKQFRPIAFKPRLLYNNGIQTVPDTALGIQTGSIDRGYIYVRDENNNVNKIDFWNQMTTLTAVPVNYNTGQDLHFNNDLYSPYFQSTANGKTKNDAYRTYWATYINSLYDIDARKLTCNVYLKPTEIQNIALNDRIFIDGQYYRINKISGANLTRRDSVEVELIKILAQQLKFPRRVTTSGASVTVDFNSLSINGTGRYINTDTGAYVDDYNQIKGPGIKDQFKVYNSNGTGSVVWDYQQPEDNTNQFDQTILGTNNIAIGASKVNALGNNNQVKEGTETSFIVGSENFIGENTSNVTIIGQGHSVDEQSQNAQIVGGTNGSISGSVQSTIIGSFNTTISNSDYAISINGENDTIRDSDFITAINSHTNEVIINGSGHAVIGLNLEGAGLDLLNTRENSVWLGDTYIGEALFSYNKQLECGDAETFDLSDLQYKHDHILYLNWSGLSPGTTEITLPNAVNNDYKKIIYTFVSNDTFDGTTTVKILPFGSQTINGNGSFIFSNPNEVVTLYAASGSNWVTLNNDTEHYGAFYDTTDQSASLANTAYSMSFNTIDINGGVTISGSTKIYPNRIGTYDIQFSAQYKKNTGGDVKVYTWLAKNGTDVPNSNTEITIAGGSGATAVAAWNFFGTTTSTNDYFELRWGSDTAGTTIEYTAAPTIGPAIPSIILTVDQIS